MTKGEGVNGHTASCVEDVVFLNVILSFLNVMSAQGGIQQDGKRVTAPS